MNSQIEFLVKVLILSVGLSVLIKYGGPLLSIAPTNSNAVLGITIPPLIMALALWQRTYGNH